MRADDRLKFNVTDGTKSVGVDCLDAASPTCPTFSAKARAWSSRAFSPRQGRLSGDQILAKHDERYMPREVVEALKKQGRWQEGEATK